jgi:class 3 adenylate cyclase
MRFSFVEASEDKIDFLAANFLFLISKAMTQRRLAAIMFTDIVGYTALMGSDEDKVFQVLRQNRQIQQSLIIKYN